MEADIVLGVAKSGKLLTREGKGILPVIWQRRGGEFVILGSRAIIMAQQGSGFGTQRLTNSTEVDCSSWEVAWVENFGTGGPLTICGYNAGSSGGIPCCRGGNYKGLDIQLPATYEEWGPLELRHCISRAATHCFQGGQVDYGSRVVVFISHQITPLLVNAGERIWSKEEGAGIPSGLGDTWFSRKEAMWGGSEIMWRRIEATSVAKQTVCGWIMRPYSTGVLMGFPINFIHR